MSAPNTPDASSRAHDVMTPGASRRRRSFEAKREEFLAALADGWSVAHASRLVGFNRSSLYAIKREDAEFAARWDEAVEVGLGRLEDLAREGAEQGWWETVEDGGGNVLRRTHRKDPRLALRLRELRKPPETTLNLRAAAEVTVRDPEVIERRVAALAEGRRLLAAGLLSAVGLSDETRERVLVELGHGDVVDADVVRELPATGDEGAES